MCTSLHKKPTLTCARNEWNQDFVKYSKCFNFIFPLIDKSATHAKTKRFSSDTELVSEAGSMKLGQCNAQT